MLVGFLGVTRWSGEHQLHYLPPPHCFAFKTNPYLVRRRLLQLTTCRRPQLHAAAGPAAELQHRVAGLTFHLLHEEHKGQLTDKDE